MVTHGFGGAHFECAGARRFGSRNRGEGCGEFVEDTVGAVGQRKSGIRRDDTAADAMEKRDAEFEFERAHLLRDGRLRDEFGIYAVSTGRICLAALNSRNIGAVADAIAKVVAD